MKLVKNIGLLVIILSIIVIGCSQKPNMKSKESFGNVKDLSIYLPNRKVTWIYEGTGVYYHEMRLSEIIHLNNSIYYKINGEVLSDHNDNNYGEYLTEIKYKLSPQGWKQEINQSKLLDSRYKGMYLLKFPLEVNNTWHENVIDFNDRKKNITATIESIEFIDSKKVITVIYKEDESEYYEVRKIMEGKGIIDFKQNSLINNNYQELKYSLTKLYNEEISINDLIEIFLRNYNEAWADYYNDDNLDIFDYIQNNSTLELNILAFAKNDQVSIRFKNLSIESIKILENEYIVNINEVFYVINEDQEYSQSYEKEYVIIKEEGQFKIKSIE